MDQRRRHMRNPSNPDMGLCGKRGNLKFAKLGNKHRVTCRACQRELEWQDSAFPEEK